MTTTEPMNEPMTAQELFDTVATHLLTQRERSILPEGGLCAYRGANGLKCAAGAVLPDALYHAGLEGRSIISAATGAHALFSGLVGAVNMQLLLRLQAIHDGGGNWSKALRYTAQQMALGTACVDHYPTCVVPRSPEGEEYL